MERAELAVGSSRSGNGGSGGHGGGGSSVWRLYGKNNTRGEDNSSRLLGTYHALVLADALTAKAGEAFFRVGQNCISIIIGITWYDVYAV